MDDEDSIVDDEISSKDDEKFQNPHQALIKHDEDLTVSEGWRAGSDHPHIVEDMIF